jgi:hypothetical protein
MMDLSEEHRAHIEFHVGVMVEALTDDGQSLAIAREAMINAFDEAAEKIDGTDA